MATRTTKIYYGGYDRAMVRYKVRGVRFTLYVENGQPVELLKSHAQELLKRRCFSEDNPKKKKEKKKVKKK